MRGWIAFCCALVALLAVAAEASADVPSFEAKGSVEQVYATGLTPETPVSLLDEQGQPVQSKNADELGGVLFRNVTPGPGYKVEAEGTTSEPLEVLTTASAPPDTNIYEQTLPESGYGYLTTRDGTKLAIDVHPPQDVTHVLPGVTLPPLPSGPLPTLIEYSGYGYANPEGPENGIQLIANLMGFTVVDVNMRGTGCSGGAYDFFEPLQNLDGYDVVETVAHQSWAANHKVGMMGISYGGISQLFTAATQPPDLAAISPLSVIDNTQTTLYPGGILNTGFALEWAKERVHDAEAASEGHGQGWAYKRIQEGDATCAANQALHPEAVDLLKKVEENDHYVPKVADPLSPVTFVDKIDVPTFMACQWTDEQTGGHCPDLAEHFTGTDDKWFTFTNGTHIDSLDPATFNRWYDFLELFVAKQAPIVGSAVIQAGAPLIYKEAMGIEGLTLPPDPVQLQPTYEGALKAFEEEKPIRVLFDNGGGQSPGQSAGEPYPGFEEEFEEFPIPGTEGRSWYLSKNGGLSAQPGAEAGADGFEWNASALLPNDFSGSTGSGENGLWTALPEYHWEQSPAGSADSYLSEPLTENTTVIGAGALEAWVRPSVPNVDLQVTVSEVRPDGKETFVQNGWLRGDEAALDSAKSSALEPVLSLRESDVSPLPTDRFTKVTIPLYYEGHAYRTGSRIRVTISAPNGTQPIWSFAHTQPETGGAQVAIGYGGEMSSRLLLPVVPGVEVPTGLPPCPGLRGEPCREYVPFTNRSADLTVPAGGGEQAGGGQTPGQGKSPTGGSKSGQPAGAAPRHHARCRRHHHHKRHHHGRKHRRKAHGRCGHRHRKHPHKS